MLRFTLARPHLLIFVLVPLLFTNDLRLMCCGLRLTCYVLCFARYVNVTSRSNTRARMAVTQHHLSPSAHIRYNQKARSEIEKQWLPCYAVI